MEVIAVYRELKIKTYGLNLMGDLSLVELSVPFAGLERVEQWLEHGGPALETAPLIVIEPDEGGKVTFSLCLDRQAAGDLTIGSALDALGDMNITVGPARPVDLIHFHGPHFGDRYGIAQAAFQALAAGSIPLLLSAFSVSSIYLAVPGGDGRRAVELLSEQFEAPGAATGKQA